MPAFARSGFRRRRGDGNDGAMALAVTVGCRVLFRFGLIGGRSAVAGSGLCLPPWSHPISTRRISRKPISIWSGGSRRSWCPLRRCRARWLPASRSLELRVAARGLVGCRLVGSRLVRCGGVVARPVVRRGLRIIGAARRGVLRAVVAVAGGRIAVDQRRKAVVSGRMVRIRPPRPCRRALKRHVCQCF